MKKEENNIELERLFIMGSKFLKRLGYKTQVIPHIIDEDVSQVNNRLTHTLKVAELSKIIYKKLSNKYNLSNINEEVIYNCSLLHDAGHPPLGHVFEKELNKIIKTINFEGNANNLVVIKKEFGNLISKKTILATIKYPYKISENKKKGIYDDHYEEYYKEYNEELMKQKKIFSKLNEEKLNKKEINFVVLLETQIMEKADDLAYLFDDFIDMMSFEEIKTKVLNIEEKYLQKSKYNYIFKKKFSIEEFESIRMKAIKTLEFDESGLYYNDVDIINFIKNLKEIENTYYYRFRDKELKKYIDLEEYLKLFFEEINNEEVLKKLIKSETYLNKILKSKDIVKKQKYLINYIAEMTDEWLLKSYNKLKEMEKSKKQKKCLKGSGNKLVV